MQENQTLLQKGSLWTPRFMDRGGRCSWNTSTLIAASIITGALLWRLCASPPSQQQRQLHPGCRVFAHSSWPIIFQVQGENPALEPLSLCLSCPCSLPFCQRSAMLEPSYDSHEGSAWSSLMTSAVFSSSVQETTHQKGGRLHSYVHNWNQDS